MPIPNTMNRFFPIQIFLKKMETRSLNSRNRVFYPSLYRITGPIHYNPMQHTEKNIRIIRDKLSRIGIGEKNLDDEMILASYGINKFGQLCAIPKTIPIVK
jgi:hypothetical protein